ncbi:MAG: MATE family efflux transporter, partial [Nitratireductor sp.]|nr:MATE family efflux transporter [Nitratireductor sp.]
TGALGLVAIFLVDLANLFYISLLGQQELAAAIGYASTIMFFAVSVCIGFTIATSALTARAIGSGNERRAKAYAGASLIFMLAMSVIIAMTMYAAIDRALDLLGAQGRTKEIAAGFMAITIPSIPLLGIGMASAGLLRAKGDARRAMYVTLSSGISAAAFDPLLIFYFDLGITGAALSVVIVRVLFVLVGFYGTVRVHDMVRMPNAGELQAFAAPFFRIAGPAVLTQIATPLGNAYVTSAIADFGDDAVAGWAIVGRIIPLAFAAIFALSGAVGPILSQNYGAGRLDRVNSTMRDSLVFTLVYVIAMWALLALLKTPITLVFSADGDARQMIEVFCYLVAGTQIFTGFLFVANAAFNNLDHPIHSTFFNWGRATLGVIPFAHFGSRWGAEGIVIGWGLGGAVFGILALVVCFRVLRKLPHQAAKDGISVYVPPIANSPFSSGRGAGL